MAGVPIKSTNHAVKICDMAFDMMDGIRMLRDPGTGKDVEMRIGCHSGKVVAGVVGLKMPRYIIRLTINNKSKNEIILQNRIVLFRLQFSLDLFAPVCLR